MTTTDTMDTKGTVEQSIRIIEAGADYVRITAPSLNEAKNLENIKNEIRSRGYKTPLIADIHFTPNAAEIAARIVEKVRINPGNYVDKKKFKYIEYTDSQYNEEIEHIRNKFIPLLKICKEYGTALRIGTNHGSLSDRIMSRFGDTPLGMVESALEFVRICEDEKFFEIVLSMKSSNPKVMISAYRLLVEKMISEKMNYPLHLGVTEAGDGEDGRIKSSIGIGTLLEEGIGDTIRVSLTEEPEFEIPVCKILAKRYNEKFINAKENILIKHFDSNVHIELKDVPCVILSLEELNYKNLNSVGYKYSETLDKWNISDIAPDYIYTENINIGIKLPGNLKLICKYKNWNKNNPDANTIPMLNFDEYLNIENRIFNKFILIRENEINNEFIELLNKDKNYKLILLMDEFNSLKNIKEFVGLRPGSYNENIILHKHYNKISEEDFINYSAIDFGSIFIDGLTNGIWINSDSIKPELINSISFGILQATRMRISKTEYIACPSCGRTLFDLQITTDSVRRKTNHLKGLKIAIMGCIVNGPGEMADADYGYVGSGIGKITLYKGKEVVKRSLNSENAIDELINLIKENGDWVDP
jgi:(E)-4-hydroxy-3-methylbut-2-enyl-diphosphate synthase